MSKEIGVSEDWDRLMDLHRRVEELLADLDDLGLHQAAAYVSMAVDAMRRARPDMTPLE